MKSLTLSSLGTKLERLRHLPLVDAVEQMTVVDEEPRRSATSYAHLGQHEVEAKYLHVRNPLASFRIDMDFEIRTGWRSRYGQTPGALIQRFRQSFEAEDSFTHDVFTFSDIIAKNLNQPRSFQILFGLRALQLLHNMQAMPEGLAPCLNPAEFLT